MKNTVPSLGENLVVEGLLTSAQLKQIESEMHRTQESFQKVLRKLSFIDEKKFLSFLSQKLGIPEIEISHQIVKKEVLAILPQDIVRRFRVLPILRIGKRLTVATSDPFNLNLIDQLRIRTGYEIEQALATESEIRSAIEQYYGVKSDMSDMVQSMQDELTITAQKEIMVPKEIKAEEAPIIKLVNTIVSQAQRDGASDVHVSPEKDKVIVRYRVDGILREVDHYPKELHSGVVSRIKVISNLDIAESRMPQDGRVRMEFENQPLDLRVSIMPTVHGENLVIRLLNLQGAVLPLEKLGMNKENLTVFRETITKPYGILLITGPTGSGKTTTLYAALNQVNNAEKNIVTIEDPVEYQLPLVRQIQVNAKVNLTFANGLRSILRQDPDIIMVGEIRDKETADISIQAALTGHFVFSTLHTNDAASAFTRLLDMGVEPFLVASTVTCVIAQRLVRTICSECKGAYPMTEGELNSLKSMSGTGKMPAKIYRGKGCLNCKQTGYRGRSGIFEVITPNADIRRMALAKSSNEEIKRKAVELGMRTLREDGFEKIVAGVTTIEEVIRATHEGN